jgi:hypothetical protein
VAEDILVVQGRVELVYQDKATLVEIIFLRLAHTPVVEAAGLALLELQVLIL